jgi:murein peptide amidase A
MPAVKTCPLDPADLVARFRTEALRRGFREEPWGERDGVTLSAYTKRAQGKRPRIYLSAGVHGDEPAPPEALLAALAAGIFDERATWFLIPMVNPTGFFRNQRENIEGVDLNRDYLEPKAPETRAHVSWLGRQPGFDLAVCLHEDWEAAGFYLYELARDASPQAAQTIRNHVAQVLPIEAAEVIDGRPADEAGIIRPESDPALRVTWPEAIYLFNHHTHTCYTFETPSAKPMQDRVAAQLIAMRCALEAATRAGAVEPRPI